MFGYTQTRQMLQSQIKPGSNDFRQFWTDFLDFDENFAKLYWIFQMLDNLTCNKILELV